MNPFRLVIIVGCGIALLGAGYMSYYGVGLQSGDLAANAASLRAGSSGGGYNSLGRIK